MADSKTCAVCTAGNRDEMEALGIQAASGGISWNKAKVELGLTDQRQLQRHMSAHYAAKDDSAEQARFDALVEETVEGFYALMRGASPEKRTQYLLAIRGLRDMGSAKVNHTILASTLKTLQEQQQQQSILQFVENMFPNAPVIDIKQVPALDAPGEEVEGVN